MGCAFTKLDGTDIQRLRREREGFDKKRDRNLNQRNRITVRVEGAEERPVVAEVYVAVPTEDPGLPSTQYVGYLVAAAAGVRSAEVAPRQACGPFAGCAGGSKPDFPAVKTILPDRWQIPVPGNGVSLLTALRADDSYRDRPRWGLPVTPPVAGFLLAAGAGTQ